jgi:hypothetical protein
MAFSLSTQFSLLWWCGHLRTVLGIGRNRFFMQLLLKYEILDTLSGGYLVCNYSIRHALFYTINSTVWPVSHVSKSHIENFLEKLMSSSLWSFYAGDIFVSS